MDTRHNHTPKTSNTPLQNEQNLNIPIEPTAPEPISYEEGYLHGRVAERSLDNQIEQDRSETTAARGLVLGIALASLVGLTAGVLFYLNQRDESPTPARVVAPAAPQPPNRETTIIERTTENTQRTTPVNPASPQPPDIRVIIPTPVPPAPAPQNTTPQRQPSVEEPGIRQPSTSSQTTPSSSRNQTSTGTSTTTESNTTNQSSRTPSQNQTTSNSSDTSTSTTTQPNSSDRTSAGQSSQSESTTSGSSSSSGR